MMDATDRDEHDEPADAQDANPILERLHRLERQLNARRNLVVLGAVTLGALALLFGLAVASLNDARHRALSAEVADLRDLVNALLDGCRGGAGDAGSAGPVLVEGRRRPGHPD